MINLFFKSRRENKFDGRSILDENLNLNSTPTKYAYQFYAQIYNKLVEILDSVYSGYPVGKYFFIPVDDLLEEKFNNLRYTYLRLDQRPDIQQLKTTSLIGFRLVGNFNRYIESWAHLKDTYYEDVEILSKTAKTIYIMPPDLQVAFDVIDKLLKEHSAMKYRLLKSNKFINNSELLDFGAEESTIKTIFNILLKANGGYVKVRVMGQEVDKSDAYIRAVVGEIKKKIISQRKEMLLKIEPSGKGSYRLIVSL